MFADDPTFFDKLPSNPWIFLGLAVVAVLSLISAFVFYFRSIKDRAPCYSIRHTNLIHEGISATIPALEIHYRGVGEEVKNFSVTKVRIWNSGKEPIRKTDVVKAEPITVSVADGAVIYDAEIIQEKHTSNNFALSRNQERTKATLSFDHMALEEGVVIQILHSGKARDDVRVTGKLVDGKGMKKRSYAMPLISADPRRRWFMLFPLLTSLLGMVTSIIGSFLPVESEPPLDPAYKRHLLFWTFTMTAIFFALFFGSVVYVWYRGRPSKGFEAFDTMP